MAVDYLYRAMFTRMEMLLGGDGHEVTSFLRLSYGRLLEGVEAWA